MAEQNFRVFCGSVHAALVHAATQYDIRQSRGKRHNPYALAQYLTRIDEVEADIAAGATARAALCAAFSDRMLDCLLVALGEPKHSRDELDRGWSYQPVKSEGR